MIQYWPRLYLHSNSKVKCRRTVEWELCFLNGCVIFIVHSRLESCSAFGKMCVGKYEDRNIRTIYVRNNIYFVYTYTRGDLCKSFYLSYFLLDSQEPRTMIKRWGLSLLDDGANLWLWGPSLEFFLRPSNVKPFFLQIRRSVGRDQSKELSFYIMEMFLEKEI